MKGIVHRGLLAVAPVLLGIGCRAERMTQPAPGSVVRSATIGPAVGTGALGMVLAWGNNAVGELGNGTNATTSPFGVNTPGPVSGLSGMTGIAGGEEHSLAVKSDGTAWAWGDNGTGELGADTHGSSFSNTPLQVLGPGGVGNLTGVTAIAGGDLWSLALKSDGTVWAWGWNFYGQLGNGTNTTSNTPVEVSGLSGVTAIAAGNHGLALKSDGTIWAWGNNGSGQLGNGTFTNSTTPVQVSGLSGVTSIAAGVAHSLALKSDGTIWAWGNNGSGQLGNGTFNNSNTPVQVSGLSGVTAIAGANENGSLAVKSDGTVWAWGDNFLGQLGNGTFTNTNTPVQVLGTGGVGFLSGVTAVASGSFLSLALKSDGTVWAWGSNFAGGLGNGTFTNSTTPVQVLGVGGVGNLTGVTVIAGGGFGWGLALERGASAPPLAIVPPPAITVATDVGRCDAQVNLGTPTTAGGTPPITVAATPGGPYSVGQTTVTWTATDASGTMASATQFVTVRDQELPGVVPPPNVSTVTDPGKLTASVSPGVATATDNCPGVTVTGARNDGQALNAPYPVGQTIITWTATDASANSANASQSVTVLSPQAQMSNLETSVTNLALPRGTTTSLLTKLNDALAAANAGDVATACASLQAFINETRAQAGKMISISDANTLSAAAQRIRVALGC